MPLETMLADAGVKNGFDGFLKAGVDGSLGKTSAIMVVSIPIKLKSQVSC